MIFDGGFPKGCGTEAPSPAGRLAVTADPLAQGEQSVHRVEGGGRDTGAAREFAYGTEEGVEFEGPAAVRVLQHRGTERAELAGDVEPVVGRHGALDAESGT